MDVKVYMEDCVFELMLLAGVVMMCCCFFKACANYDSVCGNGYCCVCVRWAL